jgi:TrpR-related protein YerC/YecD
MNNKWDNKKTEALAEAILALRDKSEAKKFLRDLLTEPELIEFGNRWQAAQMLNDKISYSTIRGKTGLSPRTIARISLWLNKGMGGYQLMLNRLALHHHNSSPLNHKGSGRAVGKGLR